MTYLSLDTETKQNKDKEKNLKSRDRRQITSQGADASTATIGKFSQTSEKY